MYVVFAGGIVAMVIASNKQDVDLVSDDYYKDEIAYQKVLDASKNEAHLAGSVAVHANADKIFIDFPGEFANKAISGNVHLYSPVSSKWDKTVAINVSDDRMDIPRGGLKPSIYSVKVSYEVAGKDYYYETQIDLSKS